MPECSAAATAPETRMTDCSAPTQRGGMRSVRHRRARPPRPLGRGGRGSLVPFFVLIIACSGDPDSADEPTGGAPPTSGVTGVGGVATTGGSPTGGVEPTGGDATGGTPSGGTGGNAISGGTTTTGGAQPTGGAGSTGGTAGGNAPTGGTPPTGGITATGGSGYPGGATPMGGTTPSGGASSTGGAGAGGAPSFPELVLQESATGFCSVDGVVESTNPGFTGSGYANTNNALGTTIEWGVEADAPGSYTLEFTYAHPDADRPADLLVNGATVVPTLSFPSTGDFATWTTVTTDVALAGGESRIELRATGDGGLANIDALTIVGQSVSPIDCAPGVVDLPDLTVYVAGDSTVSTYTDTSSTTDQAGWGQMLHEIFDERVTVENRAIGGRTALWFHLEGGTAWILDRIQPGDYFFVQFGTNDSNTTATFTVDGVTYPRFADANTDFKQQLYDYYVVPTRERSAVPVLVTPPPRNSAYCGVGNSLGGYAQAMRDLGAEQDVLVLDNNQRTFDYLSAICPAPTPENFFFVRTDGTVDGTHFQENGARAMAEFLGDEMATHSAGPYQYLLP